MNEIIKILVVEENELERTVLAQTLAKSATPVEIQSVGSACEAIATLKGQIDFECIFLNYQLPDSNGLELVQKIRGLGIKIPMVVLIASGDEQIAADLIKGGAYDYIPHRKISSESLARSLHNAVRVYRAEQEVALANQRLRESEERYRLVLEGSNDGIWDWDLRSQEFYGNDRLLEIAGFTPGEVKIDYSLIKRLLHPADHLKFIRAVSSHLKRRSEFEVEFRLRHISGEYRYCSARGKAKQDGQGRLARMSGIVSDITDRKRTEKRSRFLAEATEVLSASLDYRTTLENLARLAVPRLADWCAIDILEANQACKRIAVAHVDKRKEALVKELGCPRRLKTKTQSYCDLNGAGKVLVTGKSDSCFEVLETHVEKLAENPHQKQLLKQLSIRSYICVPLRTGERTLGSILFVWSESGRCYNQADFKLAEDLAHRAALAIENARLFQEAHEASENLRDAITILGEQQQQLRTLQQLTNLLNRRLTDLPDLLRVMAQAVCDAITGAQICFIALFNPQCNRMMLTVTAGVGEETLSLEEICCSKSMLRQVFLTGEPKLIQQDSAQIATGKSLPTSIYAVPIESAQSGRLGILSIGNWDNQSAFDDESQYLLTAFGEQAAIAIDNARLINTLEEREERLELQNQMLAEQNQELESQRQKIQLQNLQLMEAARMKSQFLAVMSHELRTPMNAIIGFSQLMLRKKHSDSLSPRQVEMIDRIYNNGRTLLTLINDILDLSKAEAGRLELQLKEFNLVQLVETTIEELRSLAEEKDLHLHLKVAVDNPKIINDSIRLRQILVNLLSNAIKFTDQGSVTVIITELEPECVEIQVRDTGIGIDNEQKMFIFEEFRQVDQTMTRKHSGTGLGLAITESLVQLMHGTISVESELGQGSTFRVELPRCINELNPR